MHSPVLLEAADAGFFGKIREGLKMRFPMRWDSMFFSMKATAR